MSALPERVRWTVSIAGITAGRRWEYGVGKVVRVGTRFAADEIPADRAARWLGKEVVDANTPEPTPAHDPPQPDQPEPARPRRKARS